MLLLGKQVFQVRRKGTGQVYAMKVMRKERILARDHMDYVRAEREVLTAVFHPYIVTLRCSFQARRFPPLHHSTDLICPCSASTTARTLS